MPSDPACGRNRRGEDVAVAACSTSARRGGAQRRRGGGGGGREVPREARVSGPPRANRLGLGGAELSRRAGRGWAHGNARARPQALQACLVPLPVAAWTEELAGQLVLRGEHRRRAKPRVVVGHGAAPPWLLGRAGPESVSSTHRTTTVCLAGSGTARRRRSAAHRTPGLAIYLTSVTRGGLLAAA